MTGTDDRSRAVLGRDAALTRVRRTRRWVIAGSAALTAGIAALVSVVAPGRSFASKSPTGTAASSSSSTAIPQLPPAANPGSLGLQGPSQPPQSVPSSPQSSAPSPQSSGGGGVVSGGS